MQDWKGLGYYHHLPIPKLWFSPKEELKGNLDDEDPIMRRYQPCHQV
jgi:hypothetical protein